MAASSRHVYDVVVLDLSLGGQEGIGLLRLIAASHEDAVVIFVARLDDRCGRPRPLATDFGFGRRRLVEPVGASALREP